MKHISYLLSGAICAVAVSLNALAEEAAPQFQNFAVVLNDESNSMLTAEEISGKASFSFGVAVNDGVATRVAVDAASSIATVSGTYHSDHGSQNVVVVANVPGNVKVTLGTCSFGNHNASIVKGDETVASVVCASACWKGAHSSVAEMYYAGDAATIYVKGASYTPYVAIEIVDVVPTLYNISYDMSDEDVTGSLPAAKVMHDGDSYTIPSGALLYKEGYTFAGWSDGEEQYNVGDALTVNSDLSLSPVFSANVVGLADRTAETVITWNFLTNQGAPVFAWEKVGDKVITSKATISGDEIDVPIIVNTTTGKFNNSGNADWCQVNVGTKITVPVCKGAKVSMSLYGDATGTTINGVEGSEVEISSDVESAEIVFGESARYIKSLTVTLPVAEEEQTPTSVNRFEGAYQVVKVEDFYLSGAPAPSTARGYLIERTTLKSVEKGNTLIEQKPIVRK